MSDGDKIAKDAVAYFDSGYNCAESMLLAFSKALKVDCSAFPMVATPFGAGIGRLCQDCGVLTGGIMAIGLRYGRSEPRETERRNQSYSVARAYYERFEEQYETVKCIEIQGTDLKNQEEASKTSKDRRSLCKKVVEESVRMLTELFSGQDGLTTSGY